MIFSRREKKPLARESNYKTKYLPLSGDQWKQAYPSHVTGGAGVYEQNVPVLSERRRCCQAEG